MSAARARSTVDGTGDHTGRPKPVQSRGRGLDVLVIGAALTHGDEAETVG
jgi:hypothetical protein